MGLVSELNLILEKSKVEYETIKRSSYMATFKPLTGGYSDFGDDYDRDSSFLQNNFLILGNNRDYMKYLLFKKKMEGMFKLIYIDPPFFSKANYHSVTKIKKTESRVKQKAYGDLWKDGMGEYLEMLTVRLYMIKDLLAEDGTIWIHLDWHSVHYIKVLMDEIFGEKNFINEIIWTYKSGGSTKKHFARKHDTILAYGKSKKYSLNLPKEKSYNRGLRPYRFKNVEEFEDERGWYTMVNMKDVWNIDMVGRTSSERTGYATQKPETLLERILMATTVEGDLCGDFFAGSSTLGSVAERLNRRWHCCDIGPLAFKDSTKRLFNMDAKFKSLVEEEFFEKITENGRLRIDMKWEEGNLRIHLKDYTLLCMKSCLEEKSQKEIEKIIRNDGRDLLDMWFIEMSQDGKDFQVIKTFLREKKGLETDCKVNFPQVGGRKIWVKIKAMDILGNITITESKIPIA